jgi:NitT/TauT family transport system permease protein
MARSYGASELQLFRKVVLPQSVPAVMTGIRLALARALLGTLVAEWLLASYALGQMLLVYEGKFETDAVFAIVFTILVISVALMNLANSLEHRLGRWRPSLQIE